MKVSSKYFYFNFEANSIWRKLYAKILATLFRLIDIFRLLPIRIYRVLLHVFHAFLGFRQICLPDRQVFRKELSLNEGLKTFIFWCIEFWLLIMDCFGLSEFMEIGLDWIKFNSRPLYDWEVTLAREVFGDSIDYKRVRIDEYAFFGPKQKRFAYVSFYHINCWGAMQNSILIHELVHIWQYEQRGAIYMARALRAQYSQKGYDYGGIAGLMKHLENQQDFLSFNYEQQGDIVADYFRIKNGYRPQWGTGKRVDLPLYEYFIKQIRNPA